MSTDENIIVYCDDCGSHRVVVVFKHLPRMVSLDQYADEQHDARSENRPPETRVVRCLNCGKSRELPS